MTQIKKASGKLEASQNSPKHFANPSAAPSKLSLRLLRMAQIATTPESNGMLPVSPATIWRWVKNGQFPAPYKLGEAVTVWSCDEIEAFIAQRAGGAAQ